MLVEYADDENVFDKVKGAFKIGENKKSAFVDRQRFLTVAPVSPARSMSISPLRSRLGSRNEGKLNINTTTGT